MISICDFIGEIVANKIIDHFPQIKKGWFNSRFYKFYIRYDIFKKIKSNQKIFTSFILLSSSNADKTETKHQKQMYSIKQKLDKAVFKETEMWTLIKSRMTSPKEKEVLTELLLIDSIKISDCLSKSNIKHISKKRLKCGKQYNKWCNKYAKNQIDNYQIKKLDCFNDFVKATQTYYKLLYLYLPTEKRTDLEKYLK